MQSLISITASKPLGVEIWLDIFFTTLTPDGVSDHYIRDWVGYSIGLSKVGKRRIYNFAAKNYTVVVQYVVYSL